MNGLIYVVNGATSDRLEDSKAALYGILEE
jgi:hypothetical protein